MSAFTHHLRHAARTLRQSPAYTIAIVASLGISIAAIASVFSIADAVLFRTLPYRDAERLVWVGSVRTQRADGPFSLPEFVDYAERARTADLAGIASWGATMPGSPAARRLQGMRISANAFEILGMTPAAGRLLRPDDDHPDAPRVALLSHAFWREAFGADRSVVGQTIRLNDHPHEIVGVLPPRFPMPIRGAEVVVPLAPELDPNRHLRGSTNFLVLFGRIRGDASPAAVRQELSGIAADLRTQFPSEYADKLGVVVGSLHDYLVGNTRQAFVLMLGASVLLLLIALANVLSLMLVRGAARQGETAVRRALGASRLQLAYGSAAESTLVALAAAGLGTLLAKALVAWVAGSSLGVLRLDEARLDGRTLLFVIAVAVVVTLLCSAIALVSTRRVTPRQALAAIGRGQHGSRGVTRLRSAFLVTQLAFAFLLTAITATMAQSLARLQAVELGYRPDSVFVARAALPPRRSANVPVLEGFVTVMERALRDIPGVVAAGVTSIAPLSEGLRIVPFSVSGRAPERDGERLEAHLRAVSAGYLDAIGARMAAGRPFDASDGTDAAPVAIVSRGLAERYLAGSDPVGRQLLVHDNNAGPRPITVVGIVEDMRHVSLDGPPTFDIYVPMSQLHPDGLRFVTPRQFWTVRVAGGGGDVSRAFLRAFADVDAEIAVSQVEPMRAYVDGRLASRRFSVGALLGFAGVALVLAIVGVYGLVASSVAQRRREIGLRLALGATTTGVVRTFVQPTLVLAVAAVASGVAAALLVRQLVAGLLFGVTPTEPWLLICVTAAFLLTCIAAAAVPARRAAAVDPVVALKVQ